MDTRFFRIDNGRIIFYDLDLPEVISFKQSLLGCWDKGLAEALKASGL